MPGVNPPVNERLPQLIADLHNRLRALETQQQLAFSNAVGELIGSLGAVPGYPGTFGIVGWSGYNGNAVFFITDTSIPDGSGRRQTQVVICRDDGSGALVMSDLGTVPNHPHQQALQWMDRTGNVVIADDTNGGVGVARPHIPTYALQNASTATWPQTSATTATQISQCYVEYQQPKLGWVIQCYAPANVTGLFTLQYNGTTIGTQTVVGGAGGLFLTWSNIAAVPSGLGFGQVYSLVLLAQVTAGTGTVYAQSVLIQGQGS